MVSDSALCAEFASSCGSCSVEGSLQWPLRLPGWRVAASAVTSAAAWAANDTDFPLDYDRQQNSNAASSLSSAVPRTTGTVRHTFRNCPHSNSSQFSSAAVRECPVQAGLPPAGFLLTGHLISTGPQLDSAHLGWIAALDIRIDAMLKSAPHLSAVLNARLRMLFAIRRAYSIGIALTSARLWQRRCSILHCTRINLSKSVSPKLAVRARNTHWCC
jgi:hypothetical protein